MSMRKAGFASTVALLVLAPRAAHADDTKAATASIAPESKPEPEVAPAPPPKAAEWESPPSKHRSGFMVSLGYGVGIANVSGFPNDPTKVGYTNFYTNTGVRPIGNGSLIIGGALTDWFNFGVGFSGGQMFATGDNKVAGGGIVFHVDAYPFLALQNRYPDLGVSLEAGLGSYTVTPTDNADHKLIDSGAASILGGGVFWEPIHTWRIKMGPFLMGSYSWSDSLRRPAIYLGFRSTLYAGKLDK